MAKKNDTAFFENKLLDFIVRYYPHHFESLEHARNWFADFIHWYNFEHKHSSLQFVTPMQK